jgi:hypothetical protein
MNSLEAENGWNSRQSKESQTCQVHFPPQVRSRVEKVGRFQLVPSFHQQIAQFAVDSRNLAMAMARLVWHPGFPKIILIN